MEVSEIRDTADISLVFPDSFSFFEPYLRYQIKEIMQVGGAAYLARDPEGRVSGLFIYDNFEKSGTIYTRSREVFDHFFQLMPFNFIFSEMAIERENEIYDIYTIDFRDRAIEHSFSHEIRLAGEGDTEELERFMVSTHNGINPGWVKVALMNGERCFTAWLGSEIAGLAWVSLVNGIGRLHTLYVKPQFRGMKIGEDLLFARLLWAKSMNARSAFSEVARQNHHCSRIALKAKMGVAGQIFQYFRPERKNEIERLALLSRS